MKTGEKMRIELKDENTEEITKEKEPELKDKHESDLTGKEKRELERQKLQSMNFTGKLQYIWAYYKAHIFVLIGIIVLIFIVKDTYNNAKIKTALSIMVIDSAGSDYEENQQKIEEVLGVQDDPYQEVGIDESLHTDTTGEELDAYGQMAFVAKIQAKSVDVLILPEAFYEKLEESEYFEDLNELLGDEVYNSFGDSIDSHHITFTYEELGEQFGTIYEPVCVAVLINSEQKENAAAWIASLVK